MSAVSPHPVGSLYCMYDSAVLQGEEGSINRYPVECSYFFPPPKIGVGNRAAKLQQMPQDRGAYGGNPEGYALQKGAGGYLVFGYAHPCAKIKCNLVALIIIYIR
jgi:hypothetical protein